MLAAAALTALGAVPASAHQVGSVRATATDGVTETTTFTPTVPRPVYDPDPTATDGPRQCVVLYHEDQPTPGCGGFAVSTVLHNVRNQPGYLNNVTDNTYFTAHADAARTFGCRTADGTFDWNSAFVVREKHLELTPVYFETESSYLIYEFQTLPGDWGPQFYVNFDPVDFSCPAGQTKVQYGLKVSNISVEITNSPVFGTHTWKQAGPYYG
jgi:hypothetical protein